MDLVITGARLLDRAGLVDIAVSSAEIAAIVENGQAPPAERSVDASGNLVTTPFIEPHFHLDKVLSRDVLGATSATEAFDRAREAKAQFTAADVEKRASQAIRLAAAHGIAAIRAQVDVDTASRADQHQHMTTVFEIAEEFDVPVDMHIDYWTTPT